MQSFYDYKKFLILYVDDEEKSLKVFKNYFSDYFRILTATNAADGMKLIEAHGDEIAVLMTDQRMPGERGVELLEKARQLRPRMVRILVTAYADFAAAIQAVNDGAIYRYISKPWEVDVLRVDLSRAMEFFIVQRERDGLLREKLSALHNLMITDRVVSMGVLASGLSHHLRNALVAVQTFIELAPAKLEEENVDLEQLRNPNFWKDFYTRVQAQIDRITELLSELDMANSRPVLRFEDRVAVCDVVAGALNKLADPLAAKNLTAQNEISPDLPAIQVDQPKFGRLFELLLKDELTNLPEGSRITFQARALPAAAGRDAEVQIEIHDNGPGLPQEALRRVFDPFVVRIDDPQEFGINLMACYFIVYHHGGRIEVKSPAGGGTTFLLTFPVNPPSGFSRQGEQAFLSKVLMNETLWEKLLAGK